jgi:pilus assembly protein Flp/PilA
MNGVRCFIIGDDGPTATEYAVMLAFIIMVCITSIGALGTAANTMFGNVATGLAS